MTPQLPPCILRRRFRLFASGLVGLFLSLAVHAADPVKMTINVPAGTADKSLKQFSEQTGRQIIFLSEVGKGIRTNAVDGEMTPQEALEFMLDGTGLVSVSDAKSEAFSIRRETPAELKNVNRAIAQDSGRPVRNGKTELDANGEPVVKLDTFEVFGKKTLNMDIRRTRDDVQPYVTFNAHTIENSGATTLEEFFRTRLPMNSQTGPNGAGSALGNQSSNGSLAASNQSAINLRGLGSKQTLILVDGHRLPGTNATSTQRIDQPDINGIPLSAIERVEILPSTAGGIYGGGATGGVINIILKRNYAGAEVTVSYGNTFDGVMGTQKYSLLAGWTFQGGRTRFMLTAGHEEAGNMQVGDRDFALRIRQAQLISLPRDPSSPIGLPYGYTANILSNTLVAGVRQSLVLDNGTALNSTFTSIPVGYAGVGDGGVALVAKAGIYNLSMPNDSNGNGLANGNKSGSLLTSPKIDSFLLNVRHEFTKDLEGFAEADVLNNYGSQTVSTTANSTNQVVIGADAPNNPFRQDILVNFPTPEITPGIASSRSETKRFMSGFILRLPRNWQIELDHVWSTSTSQYSSRAGQQLNVAGTAAIGSGTLDILKDVNLYPVSYSPYFSGLSITASDPFETTTQDSTFRFGGEIPFRLLGGPINLAGYIEYQNIKAGSGFVENDTVTGGQTFVFTQERRQSIESGYLELRSNVFSNAKQTLFLRNLELQISGRWDRYNTTQGASANGSQSVKSRADVPPYNYYTNKIAAYSFTAGLRWAPVTDLAFRASIGSGFLPPSVNQISPQFVLQPAGQHLNAFDPKRGNTQVGLDAQGSTIPGTFTLGTGGSPDLRPENSIAESAGVIYTPRFLQGLRLSVDYSRIEKTDEIASPTDQQIINAESNLPGRITRGSNLPGDLPGWAGPIIGLNIAQLNFAKTTAEAFDFQADYMVRTSDFGSFSAYLLATRQTHLQRQLLSTSPIIESVDYLGGPLKWKGNLGVTWESARWTFGWNVQYYYAYNVYPQGTTVASIASRAAANGGSARTPAQRYHDIFIKYKLADGGINILRNTSLTLGIQNLFNTTPPLANLQGYDIYGDPRLRRFELTVKKAL